MASQIDHLVIIVRDLDMASEKASAAGFTVVPGGEHGSGLSHNALIAFQDGSYIELFAFLDPNAPTANPWWTRLWDGGGLVDYALLSQDLAAETAAIQTRGVDFPEPWRLGRTRPDGERLEWHMATPERNGWPFLIQDETPRALRVPDETQDATHPNGAIGVAGVTIVVPDLEAARGDFAAITGSDPVDLPAPFPGVTHALQMPAGTERDQWFCLIEPDMNLTDGTDEASIPARYLTRYGAGPFAIALRTSKSDGTSVAPGRGELIERDLLGGARVYLA